MAKKRQDEHGLVGRQDAESEILRASALLAADRLRQAGKPVAPGLTTYLTGSTRLVRVMVT